jgi:hypothetical protein
MDGGRRNRVCRHRQPQCPYLYLDTGNVDTADIAGPISVSGRVQDNMVRLALSYRLPVAW